MRDEAEPGGGPTRDEAELSAAPGFIEPEVRTEFPGLRLDWVSVDGGAADSPPAVQLRLRQLSNRYRGASVVAMRTQPIPHAYRAFFRQIGLDPDTSRVPSEQAALTRLLHGSFRSQGRVEDALLIALIETGVPVWALDGGLVDAGGLGVRLAVEGERLGRAEHAGYLPGGTLVVADAQTVHAQLFGEVAPGHEVTRHTDRVVLFAVGVEGVPAIHVEEALWVCVEVLGGG
jgi:DNA/RNA-binding domain of Phe-tRNA-synthetase-like protein